MSVAVASVREVIASVTSLRIPEIFEGFGTFSIDSGYTLFSSGCWNLALSRCLLTGSICLFIFVVFFLGGGGFVPGSLSFLNISCHRALEIHSMALLFFLKL